MLLAKRYYLFYVEDFDMIGITLKKYLFTRFKHENRFAVGVILLFVFHFFFHFSQPLIHGLSCLTNLHPVNG